MTLVPPARQTEKTVYLKTFGCQMNEYDSERLETISAQAGFLPVETEAEASLVIINTCSIREKAEDKMRSFLGTLREQKLENPSKRIVIAGCVAQQEGAQLLKDVPWVDLVLGTDQVDHFDRYLAALEHGESAITATGWSERRAAYNPETMPTGRKSFVSIMKGCDKICTYCIVPFTRGREKSRPIPEVLNEVRYLVSRGHKEITLIGQNVNSYGKDLGQLQFAQLLYQVAEIDGVKGIRFTTSHPIDLSDDLVQAFRDIPKLCSWFHLPVQCGSDRVLQAMRREYSIAWYLDRLTALREARPDIAISTDFIVGFPGETEADFLQTMELVEKARYDAAYSFIYSPRPHTRALKLKDDVNQEEKVRRFQTLHNRVLDIACEINRKHEGQVMRCLVEGPSRRKPERWSARSNHNKVVHFYPGENPPKVRDYVDIEIVTGRPTSLKGRLVTLN